MAELRDPSVLRAILDGIGDGVVAFDADGRSLYWNAAASQLVGIEPRDGSPTLAGLQDSIGIFQPDEQTAVRPDELAMARALRGEATDRVEVFVRNPRLLAGVHLSVSGRPLRDDSGAIVGGVVVFRDIAKRRRTERELRQANRFLDSIVENIPDMIFVKEAGSLRFERFNRAGEALLGLRREQLIGRNDRDLFPPDQADFFTERDRETLTGRRLVDIPEEPIQTPRGERWLHTKKIPILDDGGEPRYLLGISSDITEQRSSAAALRRAHELLEARVEARTADLRRAHDHLVREMEDRERAEAALAESERQFRQAQKLEAVGRLAGGVAHDFNNLLTVIAGYNELILSSPHLDSTSRTGAQEVQKAAERAAALTRQLLAFSRRQVLMPKVVDLNRIIAGIGTLLGRLIGEDIDVVTQLAPDIGCVRVDPGQIEQVMMNLAINARDAMPDGGTLTITTSPIRLEGGAGQPADGGHPADGESRRHVRLRVTDTGHGMDAETQSRIFEPFFTTKGQDRGTGLGLATVYGIVKQSGGNIQVTSEPGAGTSFQIDLPVATDKPEPQEPAVIPLPTHGRETILLVEDEPSLRNLLREALRRSGYTVLQAADGREALSVAAARGTDLQLVITDLVMPHVGGLELGRTLRSRHPQIRVLYMSGYLDTTELTGDHLPPGAPFLQKPFTPTDLARKVRDVLGSTEFERPPTVRPQHESH